MIGRAMLRWPASTRLLSAPLPLPAPTSSLVLSIRTYSTPGRPKSVVGEPSRPVKRAVKRAAAKPADGTSPAERKVAKSKRKAATKKRAPLTEEQKVEQQERLEAARATMKARLQKKKQATKAQAEKDKIKELKILALDPPRRAPSSGYLAFVTEKLKEMGPLGNNEDGTKSNLGQRMKDVSAGWNALTPADHEHYNHIARLKNEAQEAAYKKFVESYTPDQIRIANEARKSLNKKYPKKTQRGPAKFAEIKDERVVERPRSAYIHFVTNRAPSADFNGILAKDRLRLIGQEWKSLSAEEKTKYEELAKQDLARYNEEYKDTYGHDVPETQASKARKAKEPVAAEAA